MAKDSVEDATGLRPTNEKLLNGIRALKVPPRIKDHMRCMLLGRIKCGPFWSNIDGQAERGFCSFCIRRSGIEVVETENHMWLQCEYNGQSQAWETARWIWSKTTDRDWPIVTMGLIRGAAAVLFEEDHNKDSERFRILITLTTWAIWKARNKNAMTEQEVTASETNCILKDLISDLVRKDWIATRFMVDRRKSIRRRILRSLWAGKGFADFDLKTGPRVNFT